MNIFVLHFIPSKAAQYHNNKHVVKMILEYAQLLCTAHHILDAQILTPELTHNLYKKTHENHPCAIWTRTSSQNYIWLFELFSELCSEYTFRYGKIHKTEQKLKTILENLPHRIPHGELTPFPLAMPDNCKNIENPILSYQWYYIKYKQHIAQWKNRPIPHWFKTIPLYALKFI